MGVNANEKKQSDKNAVWSIIYSISRVYSLNIYSLQFESPWNFLFIITTNFFDVILSINLNGETGMITKHCDLCLLSG